MDINTILDGITIVTSAVTVAFIVENLLIYFWAFDVTKLWIQMNLYRQPGFIRRTASGGWKFHLAYVDEMNPKKWTIKYAGLGRQTKEIPYEVVKGSVGPGPAKVELMLISDENSGGSGIPLDTLLVGGAIGATPAHVDALEKSAYAEGYMEGFTKSNPAGVWDWARDNWQLIAIFFVLGVVGALTMWDKIYSSPAAWSATQACQEQKAIIVGKLAQCGVDVSTVLNPQQPVTATTLTPIQNAVGAVVK